MPEPAPVPAPGTASARGGAAARPGHDCDVVIVGGGIVGLSTAYAITRSAPGTRVVVLEKEPGPARHQTGRNSGVIHSGIYYRPGSLKARFAVQGAAEMVDFCARYGIPHEVTGKLIVATERDELPGLHALIQRGRQHGIPVRELGPAQIAEREPYVRGLAAIHVGTTGVCDFGAVAGRLARLAREGGAEIRYGARVTAVQRRTGTGVAVRVTEGDADSGPDSDPGSRTSVVRARTMVNCAGLHSARLALLTGDTPAARIVPFRGEYFELAASREELVRGLVYPVPDPAFPFLGVHLTRGVDGGVHIGPNAVPALALEGYDWRTVRPAELTGVLTHPGTWRMARRHWRYGAGELRRSLSKRAFTTAVRRLLPEVSADDLVPSPAGVRAQAVLRDGSLADDFLITEGPHAVHVLNAPSPAATASLPIGREIAARALRAVRALNALHAAAR
ncbi:L-2-hydroxyglutarate oxidase [Streptomyces sp. Amel2xB2]|uniref:L-2-hydroxyglutarate oxidase n=1 Tax=Streptomyces sp. Amel2xB2 TaxID=1305829 RepID=UPI000DBA2E2B|nr:L-2-hydroxyglutarate oxidase [Streptomyces sp. Amel2xB2]RAJ66804.1 L-2-hydroxyglutarate oxidase [Streptomyces sp. Amel2xB2]